MRNQVIRRFAIPAVMAVVAIAAVAVLGRTVMPVASAARSPILGETSASREALGNAVLAAFKAGDIGALERLALTEDEFRTFVWPKLPASRPDRGVPFDFVWGMLKQNSSTYLRQTANALRGHDFTLKRVSFAGASSAYAGVVVHRETELLVTDANGNEQMIRVFGSTVEQEGRFKVFSYVVD